VQGFRLVPVARNARNPPRLVERAGRWPGTPGPFFSFILVSFYRRRRRQLIPRFSAQESLGISQNRSIFPPLLHPLSRSLPVPPALAPLRPHTHHVLKARKPSPGTRISSFARKNHRNRPESTGFARCWLGGVPRFLVRFPSPFSLLSTKHTYTDFLINFQPASRSGNAVPNRSFNPSLVRSSSRSPSLEYCQQATRNPQKTPDPRPPPLRKFHT
jgi:hypothetical protein